MATCPCCKSGLAQGGAVSLCKQCETLVVPAGMKIKYDKHYYLNYIKYRNNGLSDRIQETRWATVNRNKRYGYLLDYGCGVGAFLEKSPQGYIVEGYEINPHCVEYCRSMGFQILDEVPTFGHYDIVTMFDVIEHIPQTALVVSCMEKLLAPGGILVIATPNFTKELVPNIKQWKHYKPGEHLYGFSRKSIEALCGRCGLLLIEANDDESQHRPPENNIATYVLSKRLPSDLQQQSLDPANEQHPVASFRDRACATLP